MCGSVRGRLRRGWWGGRREDGCSVAVAAAVAAVDGAAAAVGVFGAVTVVVAWAVGIGDCGVIARALAPAGGVAEADAAGVKVVEWGFGVGIGTVAACGAASEVAVCGVRSGTPAVVAAASALHVRSGIAGVFGLGRAKFVTHSAVPVVADAGAAAAAVHADAVGAVGSLAVRRCVVFRLLVVTACRGRRVEVWAARCEVVVGRTSCCWFSWLDRYRRIEGASLSFVDRRSGRMVVNLDCELSNTPSHADVVTAK